jgi:hypothetical protein
MEQALPRQANEEHEFEVDRVATIDAHLLWPCFAEHINRRSTTRWHGSDTLRGPCLAKSKIWNVAI